MIDRAREILGAILAKAFGSANAKIVRRLEPLVSQVNWLEPEMSLLSDAQLKGKTAEFKQRLAEGATLDSLLPEAFASVREAAKRRLGQRHYDVQILGGVILHRGMIAEMATGEGKTLVATCPAYLNALAREEGRQSGVHIVTVNDYLARRDAAWMGAVYDALGMTVGCIQGESVNSAERQKEYNADIVYGQNNEFGFDYLRDNMKFSPRAQVQQLRRYAIVDEVDSILIDEARTPLIISGAAEEAAERYNRADSAVRGLKGASENDLAPDIEALIKNGWDKELAKEKAEEPFDYVYSEKSRSAYLTEQGIDKCMKKLNVKDFYAGRELDWPHFLENALRAHSVYKRDVHYMVKDGEVLIVDEYTGRVLSGRRWSDGLHQAVEAKEGLRIKEENQTLATITFQNFFRLYKKLSGMTGTAMTEAKEFMQIYKLNSVTLPSNRPMQRTSFPDVIYGTEKEKFAAIADEIEEIHRIGRPVLVGTVSIEKSERLSGLLKRRGIKHDVLNAKQHEREAEIVTKAGNLGHVTIATNMAGRGTDIRLGHFTREEMLDHWKSTGLAPKDLEKHLSQEQIEVRLLQHWLLDFEKNLPEKRQTPHDVIRGLGREELAIRLDQLFAEFRVMPFSWGASVADLGGLHILGSERHESRRIDNQLRGRAGRQGDPGSSRFFLSLEDDLMRVFASEWVRNFLQKWGLADGQPLEHGMVSRAIEKAQRRVEEQHYGSRKRVLEYDQVMNEQRTLIYGRRQDVLEGRNLKENVFTMIEDVVANGVQTFIDERLPQNEWDYIGLQRWAERKFGLNRSEKTAEGRTIEPPAEFRLEIKDLEARTAREIEEKLLAKVTAAYEHREAEIGPEQLREIERYVQLDVIDKKWKQHLRDMDHLKEGIYLRAHAQKDPKLEYKREGYNLFMDMMVALYEEVTDLVLRVKPVRINYEEQLASRWEIKSQGQAELPNADLGAASAEMNRQANRQQGEFKPVETFKRDKPKVGPNDNCPCGSGKKYKKCCMRNLAK